MKKEAPEGTPFTQTQSKNTEKAATKQTVVSIVSMLILFYIQIAVL